MKLVSRGMFKRPDKVSTNFQNSSSREESILIKQEKKEFEINIDQETKEPFIIAIGGGKGGIGKSFFASNLGVSLAQKGNRVALLDLDFGAANLHSCLGVTAPKKGIYDLIQSPNEQDLSLFSTKTDIKNLTLFAGGQEFAQQIKLQSTEKTNLINRIKTMPADYVILDLGAGTHINTLDFFIFSNLGIVIVVPEPTSIENAYVFLKSIFFRKIQSIAQSIDDKALSKTLIQNLINPENSESPIHQLQVFAQENPELGEKFLTLLNSGGLSIIMNQVRTKMDRDLGASMCRICEQYFGIKPSFLGSTEFDDDVWKSVRTRRSLVSDFPHSRAASNINAIAKKIVEECRHG